MFEHLSWVLPAAKELYKDRAEIATVWEKLSTTLRSRQSKIAFTGNGGAGKTVLHAHLSGAAGSDYQPPGSSQKVERGQLPSRHFRLKVMVIPGQDRGSRLDGLNEAFDDKPADGIVHVVCGGYTKLTKTAQLLDEAVQHRFRDNDQTDVGSLESFLASELVADVRGLAEVCERMRMSIRKTGKPRWLLVAVTKCDLFYNELDLLRDFYLSNVESPFVECLREFQGRVGSDNFFWSALPVCAWLEDFVWGEEVARCQLDLSQRNHYLANLAEAIEKVVTAHTL